MSGDKAMNAAMERASTKPGNEPTSAMADQAAGAHFGQWDDWDNGHTDNKDSSEIQVECGMPESPKSA